MRRVRSSAARAFVPGVLGAALLPLAAQDDFCASPIGVSHLLTPGSAACEVVAGTTMVTLSDHAVIEWDSFNLRSDHELQFVFRDPSQAVVNRSLSRSATFVGGRLSSNGNVVLLAPESFLTILDGARISVGSFTASGLDADPAQFFGPSRALEFIATPRSNPVTRVQGRITTTQGDVVLVGRELRITAGIEAAGAVTAATGTRVLLDRAAPEQTTAAGGAQVTQQGTIRAGGDISFLSQRAVGLAGELIPGNGRGRVFVRVDETGGLIKADPSVTVRGRTEFSVPIEGSIAIIDPDEGDNLGARSPTVNEFPSLGKRKTGQRAQTTSSTVVARAGTGFTRAEDKDDRRKSPLASLNRPIGKRSFYGTRGAAPKKGE